MHKTHGGQKEKNFNTGVELKLPKNISRPFNITLA
jgi:hypothetical protein